MKRPLLVMGVKDKTSRRESGVGVVVSRGRGTDTQAPNWTRRKCSSLMQMNQDT